MKKFKLKEMIKTVVIPMFLLVGLVFTSANTVSAQTFKPVKEASVAVEAAFQTASEIAGPRLVSSERTVNGVPVLQYSIDALFFGSLKDLLNEGEASVTKAVFAGVSTELVEKFSNSSSKYKAMLEISKAKALQLVTE